MRFELLVLKSLTGDSFLKCFLRTAYVNNNNLVLIFNNNVWANGGTTDLERFDRLRRSRSYSSGWTVNNCVVAGGYGRHVCGAVAEDVREGFGFLTLAAGWVGIGPAILHGIGGQAIEAGSVDKVPFLVAYIEASVVPGRAVGEAISSKGAWGFALGR